MLIKTENEKKTRRKRRILKTMKWAMILYALYVFVFGFVIFHFISHSERNNPFEIPRMAEEQDENLEESVDHAILLESMEDAGTARLHLLSEAEKSIDITYFSFEPGTTLDVFLGAVVEAADRNVQVRILLDGFFHNLRREDRRILHGLEVHENIEVQYYEPPNLLMPWTIHNRLHDKMFIVDGKHGIIGGRNIGDRYFDPEAGDQGARDRDVWVINHLEEQRNESVLPRMQEYFDDLWEHDFSVSAKERLFPVRRDEGDEYLEHLRGALNDFQERYPEYFDGEGLIEEVHPTKAIVFIHNPIERWRKSPWVWETLMELVGRAENRVWLQSPYFIPSRQMRGDMEDRLGQEFSSYYDEISAEKLLLTNSVVTNPNIFGNIGYYYYRNDLNDYMDELYEFRGAGSIHGKTYVIDDEITIIGAYNYDPRSTYLSTESMIVVYSESFSEEVIDQIEGIVQESRKGVEGDQSRSFSPIEIMIRILSYVVPAIEPML